MTRERLRSEVKRPPLNPDHRQQRRARRRQCHVDHIPGQRAREPSEQRQTPRQQSSGDQREEVDGAAHRQAGRIQSQAVDAIDPSLQVEHCSIRADLGHRPVPSSGITSRLLPVERAFVEPCEDVTISGRRTAS